MMDFKQWIPDTSWVPQFDLVTGKVGSPAFRLETNNKDITGKIQSRLMSLTLTDNRGLESDQLDLELDDSDGQLALPSRGDVLTLELGWHGRPLTPKGKFIVDEIEHSGAPDRLTIRARSADFRGDLNVKREQSYHKQTLEGIVSTIATRNQLQFQISDDLKGISMHIDQTNESDVSFLTRIAKQEGAITSVKNGELLFICQGQNKTVSGQNISPVLITRKSGDSHRFSLSDREAYTGIIAQWQDTRTATKQTVKLQKVETKEGKIEISIEYKSNEDKSSGKDKSKKDKSPAKKGGEGKSSAPARLGKPAGVNLANPDGARLTEKGPKTKGREEPTYITNGRKGKNKGNGSSNTETSLEVKGSISREEKRESKTEFHQTTTEKKESSSYLSGTEENILTLSRIFSSKEEAERVATAAWKKMQCGAAQFSITLAMGRADIYPETPIELKGFKKEIDGTQWTLVKVTHNLNDGGFTTSLDLEIKIDEVEIKPGDSEIKT
ncbi:phage late control D family protein [Xenorhabdus szentirmaii]|uniref:Phage protein (D protein) (Modular protein) n=1 Tax=Xenorhabdus szentirmaii DSM 16338 TaxID=1427518 RepID=W1J1M1_9GAMM|nr:phage protein [Xenorhabdus szentirmaii DSM 16338]CDL83943.1 putative phage protein (D protein) (Modular protein) [Xenorhabdus szentirmaii DSM 16338]